MLQLGIVAGIAIWSVVVLNAIRAAGQKFAWLYSMFGALASFGFAGWLLNPTRRGMLDIGTQLEVLLTVSLLIVASAWFIGLAIGNLIQLKRRTSAPTRTDANSGKN